MEDALGNKLGCVEKHQTLQTLYICLLGVSSLDPTGAPPLDSASPTDPLCPLRLQSLATPLVMLLLSACGRAK